MWQPYLARASALGVHPQPRLCSLSPHPQPPQPPCLPCWAEALWEGTCHISATCRLIRGAEALQRPQTCGEQGWGQSGAFSEADGPAGAPPRDSRREVRDSHSSLLPLAHPFPSRSRCYLFMGRAVVRLSHLIGAEVTWQEDSTCPLDRPQAPEGPGASSGVIPILVATFPVAPGMKWVLSPQRQGLDPEP